MCLYGVFSVLSVGVRCDEIRGKKGIDIWGFTVFNFSRRNTAGRETSKYVTIM